MIMLEILIIEDDQVWIDILLDELENSINNSSVKSILYKILLMEELLILFSNSSNKISIQTWSSSIIKIFIIIVPFQNL